MSTLQKATDNSPKATRKEKISQYKKHETFPPKK